MIAFPKRQEYRNPAILKAAKGEACTLNTELCNYNTETTVAGHLNESWAGKGMAQKADDIVIFTCSACHDVLDGRIQNEDFEQNKYWYVSRALYLTIRRLIDKGILK